MRALSIRQPFAEQILVGKKRVEYRTLKTNIRERVYIYAGLQLADGEPDPKKALPMGVIVGTVEIVDCTGKKGDYSWHLRNPRRLSRPRKPERRPMPVWFKPF